MGKLSSRGLRRVPDSTDWTGVEEADDHMTPCNTEELDKVCRTIRGRRDVMGQTNGDHRVKAGVSEGQMKRARDTQSLGVESTRGWVRRQREVA